MKPATLSANPRAVYARHRDRAIAAGDWPFSVPFAEVQRHVRRLLKTRTYAEIAEASGVALGTVTNIGIGTRRRAATPRKYVTGYVAVRLLALKPERRRLLYKGNCDATGTRRRVQCMSVRGYGMKEQARELGWSTQTLSRVSREGRQRWCGVDLAEAVAELYRRFLRGEIPPAATGAQKTARVKAADYAAGKGWHGPDAWDFDTIDDPDAQPFDHLTRGEAKPSKHVVTPAAVWAALGGGGAYEELTIAERCEVVTILANRGWADTRIGPFLRTSGKTITGFRTRHGIDSHYDQATDAAERRQILEAVQAA